MKPVMHKHRHHKKKKKTDLKVIVRYVLGAFLIIAGVMHFLKTATYVIIVPSFIPYHRFVIYVSGLVEIALGLLFVLNKHRKLAAWATVLFFLAVLPITIAFQESAAAVVASIPWITWGKTPIVIIIMIMAFWFTRD